MDTYETSDFVYICVQHELIILAFVFLFRLNCWPKVNIISRLFKMPYSILSVFFVACL